MSEVESLPSGQSGGSDEPANEFEVREGIHALFLVRGDPKQYNLPPHPEVPTTYNQAGWTSSAVAAGLLLFGSLFAFLGSAKR